LVLALARALRIPDSGFRGQVFAYTYALFLLIKLLELAWLAWSNASDGEESRNGAYVFSAALLVYAAMTPWLAFAQFPTGDEPAYLLLTHSLTHDHDFNLQNNYANRDYRNFYPFAEIDPHTVTTKSGVVFLWHDVGMSMLLIPGYWIGGRIGSMLELNLAAAGVSLAFYLLGRRLGASVSSSVLTGFLFSFVVPMSMFASQVFPELLGAALCIWGIVAFSCYLQRPTAGPLLFIGILIGIMPWICIRFWMLGFGLFVVTAARIVFVHRAALRSVVRDLLLLGGPVLVSLAAFAAFDMYFFSTPMPNAGYLAIAASYPQFFLQPWTAALGMLIDRAVGLLPYAPIYILVLAGLLRISPQKWMLAALTVPALCYFGFMSFSHGWTGGYCPPARYILAAAVQCVPAAAAAIDHLRVRFIPIVLTIWSGVAAYMLTALPVLRYPTYPDTSPGTLSLYIADHKGIPIGFSFPSLQLGRPVDWVLVVVWCSLIAIVLWFMHIGPAETPHFSTKVLAHRRSRM
jgi:hypothetical protein